MTGDEMDKTELLENWGFGGVYSQVWTPSETIVTFVEGWVKKFPAENPLGLLLFSEDSQKHPMVAANNICEDLLGHNKIEVLIHLIDFPTLMVRFGASIEEHQEQITQHNRAVGQADLIVFSEPAVANLTPDNRFLLHMLISSRIKKKKPFLITCSQSIEELNSYVGDPILSLINLSCQAVRV